MPHPADNPTRRPLGWCVVAICVLVGSIACSVETIPVSIVLPPSEDVGVDAPVESCSTDLATDRFNCGLCEVTCGSGTCEEAVCSVNDDENVLKALDDLGPNTAVRLPEFRVDGMRLNQDGLFRQRGPIPRGGSPKMVYALDRSTAYYAGGDDGSRRLSDLWEYHLGGNTWRRALVSPDLRAVENAERDVVEGINAGQATLFLGNWYSNEVSVEEGYPNSIINHGPLVPLPTFGGLTYDPAHQQVLWAVRDTADSIAILLGNMAAYVDDSLFTLEAAMIHGAGLYWYSPGEARWYRHQGDFTPALRGAGCALEYVDAWGETFWYCASLSVAPSDFNAWSYRAADSTWTPVIDGGDVRTQVESGQAPGEGAVLRYAHRHRAVFAFLNSNVWRFDVDTQVWELLLEGEDEWAITNEISVAGYDELNDTFLILASPDGPRGLRRQLVGYSPESNQLERINFEGPSIDIDSQGSAQAGYFDTRFGVLVIYDSSQQVWVYRYQ